MAVALNDLDLVRDLSSSISALRFVSCASSAILVAKLGPFGGVFEVGDFCLKGFLRLTSEAFFPRSIPSNTRCGLVGTTIIRTLFLRSKPGAGGGGSGD